jgi:hypothetical protein
VKNSKLRSANLDMNRFNTAILSVSLCTSFLDCGGFMCTMPLILSGLASIPFTDTKLRSVHVGKGLS